jgi:hypothetical protein
MPVCDGMVGELPLNERLGLETVRQYWWHLGGGL